MLGNCVNHTLAGALRGRGDSKGPMAIMLVTFVGIRQLYLFAVTRLGGNTPMMVGLSYPVGWTACLVTELLYYHVKYRKKESGT